MKFDISPASFTKVGVESLSKMEHLKYLCIKVSDEAWNVKTCKPKLFVHAAGRVPNLVQFDFSFCNEFSWSAKPCILPTSSF